MDIKKQPKSGKNKNNQKETKKDKTTKKETKEKKTTKPKKKQADCAKGYKHCAKWVCLVAFLSGLLIFLMGLALGIYFLSWNNLITQKISKIIPYPIAIVSGTSWVTVNEFQERTNALRRYHELRSLNERFADYDLSQGVGNNYFQVTKKNLLSQMIRNILLERIAKERGIEVSDTELTEQLESIIQEHGGREVLEQKLFRIYNLSLADFSEDVIKGQLLEKKLYQHLLTQGEISADEESFEAWFIAEASNFSVFIPFKEYYWDKSKAQVKFRDEKMNEYENQLIQDHQELIAQ